MKYLFYDIESAKNDDKNGNICEFGYVLTNEKFEILEKDNILINPNVIGNWDYYVVKNLLSYPKQKYLECDKFESVYTKIKELFKTANCIFIFGDPTKADIKKINEECKRNKLEYINFTVYDIQKIYQNYKKVKIEKGLYKVLGLEGITSLGTEHNAMDDAENAMLLLKFITGKTTRIMMNLLNDCLGVKLKNKNGKIKKR